MTGRGWEIVAGLVELDRTSLRERAMDRLRSAVTSREIEPGTRLVETDLSAALDISRGTLREALRQLEYEGLIESTERGRLTVRSLSRTELADMFAVRAALEGLAATAISLLADRAGPLTGLQTAVNLLGSTDGSIGALVEADLAFHALLCRLSGNAPLMRAWETLTGPIRVAILFAGPTAARATCPPIGISNCSTPSPRATPAPPGPPSRYTWSRPLAPCSTGHRTRAPCRSTTRARRCSISGRARLSTVNGQRSTAMIGAGRRDRR